LAALTTTPNSQAIEDGAMMKQQKKWWQQLTVRDLLLFTLLVAITTAWLLDRLRLSSSVSTFHNASRELEKAGDDYKKQQLLLQQLKLKMTGQSDVLQTIEQHNIAHPERACGIHYDPGRRRWVVALMRDRLMFGSISEGNTASEAVTRANGRLRANAEIDRTIDRVSELLGGRPVARRIDPKTGKLHLEFSLDQNVVLGIQQRTE
jgi:hypothetical protein